MMEMAPVNVHHHGVKSSSGRGSPWCVDVHVETVLVGGRNSILVMNILFVLWTRGTITVSANCSPLVRDQSSLHPRGKKIESGSETLKHEP